jgi:hypothetical protein
MQKDKSIKHPKHIKEKVINNIGRRKFLKSGLTAVTAATVLSLEEKTLLAGPAAASSTASSEVKSGSLMSTGKIGKLEISRLICGGNLISGYAHSRDLTYVSALMQKYFTDEKIMDTWAICEKNGINVCTIYAGDQRAVKLIKQYREKRGGKIKWLAQINPDEKSFDFAIDYGASAVYIQGASADNLVSEGRIDQIAKLVNYGKKLGVPIGCASHNIATVIAVETAGIGVDFYLKTHHSESYWSRRREDQTQDVNTAGGDNYWDMDPNATVEVMNSVKKPWIAYKVLAAGAIHPTDGFKYAFQNGADFALVGMFDWQVADDVRIAESVIKQYKTRERPWLA